MITSKKLGLILCAATLVVFSAGADSDPTLSPFTTNIVTVDPSITSPSPVREKPAAAGRANAAGGEKKSQADVASATASFGKISASDAAYASAIDAHALVDGLKMVDQAGAFKGTVAKLFEPRGLAIVEFDENYKTALTAIVRSANFDKFPALTNLIGKKVLVTGKFIKFKESAEIVLDDPAQIKLVE